VFAGQPEPQALPERSRWEREAQQPELRCAEPQPPVQALQRLQELLVPQALPEPQRPEALRQLLQPDG
jgi:hypothetical protein